MSIDCGPMSDAQALQEIVTLESRLKVGRLESAFESSLTAERCLGSLFRIRSGSASVCRVVRPPIFKLSDNEVHISKRPGISS
jgi:hypothetical protein